MMMMIIQLLTLLLMTPQSSWKSQAENFSLLMMLPYQVKRYICIFVTRHLQQFLERYLSPSHIQAFLDIYHMLSLLDKYLYDNPKEHTHCMSLDNEYVALLKYAIHLNIDISTFPTVWAVLSILLDTQDGNLEYVKLLQEE